MKSFKLVTTFYQVRSLQRNRANLHHECRNLIEVDAVQWYLDLASAGSFHVNDMKDNRFVKKRFKMHWELERIHKQRVGFLLHHIRHDLRVSSRPKEKLDAGVMLVS